MVIWNLKEFAVNEVFLPFCATYDPRIWEVEYRTDLSPEVAFQYRALRPYYVSMVRDDHGFEWLMCEVERNITWKKLIFERLAELNFRFYEYLDPNNEFIKWINTNLKEVTG